MMSEQQTSEGSQKNLRRELAEAKQRFLEERELRDKARKERRRRGREEDISYN